MDKAPARNVAFPEWNDRRQAVTGVILISFSWGKTRPEAGIDTTAESWGRETGGLKVLTGGGEAGETNGRTGTLATGG
jgi:hypothetical protein